jgi:hypothetical protein
VLSKKKILNETKNHNFKLNGRSLICLLPGELASGMKDPCIFMKEVGWKPDRTVFNGNSIYNGTRMSEGVLLYIFFVHRYYMGIQKGQQVICRKK